MKDKKITFLINSLSGGGAEKVILTLIEEFNKKHNIHLICIEKNNYYELPNNVRITYLSDYSGLENTIKKFLMLPFLALKLKRFIKKNNIKIVQSHLYRSNYINILSKLLGSKHYTQLVTAGRMSRYLELGINGKINLFLIKHLYKRADLLIFKAKGMYFDAKNLFDFDNKFKIINNPYNHQLIIEKSCETISDFNFLKDRKYIISVGRLIPLKRNNDLIQTLQKLPSNFELIFLGDGSELSKLKDLSRTLNLDGRVHFLGKVLNPYKYISKCDFLINCSESEGFPNVLVEAMICKTFVISSDCISGPREILCPNSDMTLQLKNEYETSDFGILFPVGSTNLLIQAIIEISHDETNNYQQIIENAFNRSFSFSKEHILEEYKEVLEYE